MSNWQDQARLLKFGQKRKVKHCGTEPSAYISNGPKGLSLYCFRCSTPEFEPHGRLSAADILQYRAKDDEAQAQPYPEVVALDQAPAQAQAWLLKAFITPERASDRYGIGYDAKTERVVLPILHNLRPSGLWTARAVDGRSPKYLMGRGSSGSMWYYRQPLHSDRGSVLCIVEDVLSAIRVYEAGFSAVCILGTSVPTGLGSLILGYDVRVWTDNDTAGRNAWVKLRKALSLYGIEPQRIQSDRDPKLHTRVQIQEKLSGS